MKENGVFDRSKIVSSKRSSVCPEGRLSKPTIRKGRRDIINIDTYIPFFLVAINNSLSSGASILYREKFGIGIVDWRVTSMLAIEPGITAAHICDVIALDKAAVSRALKSLSSAGYLRSEASATDNRKMLWWLNDRGYKLHDAVMCCALERERYLIENIDPEDLEAYLRVMRKMRENIKNIQ